MLRVGLTGGIATGKSTVAALLRETHQLKVIDADQVSRSLCQPGQPALEEIVSHFGAGVLDPEGQLNRPALGRRISQDPEARRQLEAILHPRIFQAVEDQLRSWELDGESVGIVEAALMVETGSWRRYDELWVVSCDPSTQLRRLCQRQQITPEEGRRWVNAQAPLRDKEALAHRLIWNDGDPEQLRHIVADLVRALR